MKHRRKANDKPTPPHRTNIILSVVAIVVSLISAGNSIYQTVETRKLYRASVKPDVQCVVRHSSRPTDKANPLAAEMVIWNNGPITAISVSMAYRTYIVDTNTLKVPASMGISEDLFDFATLQPELPVGQTIAKQLLGVGPTAIFVVKINYYRESDMQKFSREDFFFYDSGSYYDQQNFISHPGYETIMKNLQRKMRAEDIRGPIGGSRYMPPAVGGANVNWDFSNLTDDGSWTNGIGTNSFTITPLGPAP